jgi:hypothetical protein
MDGVPVGVPAVFCVHDAVIGAIVGAAGQKTA